MKRDLTQQFIAYLYNNFLGNFLGFFVGMASTQIVSQCFATRSIKNLWGLTSKKAVVDKHTFSALEFTVSIVIGFLVFEIISKAVKKKMSELSPGWKKSFRSWLAKNNPFQQPTATVSFNEHDSNNSQNQKVRIYRDVQ